MLIFSNLGFKAEIWAKIQTKEQERLNETTETEGITARYAGRWKMHEKGSVTKKHKEKKNIIHLVLRQTLTPISPPPSISQPERICVRYASYSARPFTVTISAWVNQLK